MFYNRDESLCRRGKQYTPHQAGMHQWVKGRARNGHKAGGITDRRVQFAKLEYRRYCKERRKALMQGNYNGVWSGKKMRSAGTKGVSRRWACSARIEHGPGGAVRDTRQRSRGGMHARTRETGVAGTRLAKREQRSDGANGKRHGIRRIWCISS